MVKGLYTAWTGMIQQEHRMDVLTNNLANADTNGYKKEGATSKSFDSLLAYKIKDNTEDGRLAKRLGTNYPGVKIGEGYTDFSQGAIKETGNTYDLAINGSGFFELEFTDKAGNTSVKYSRDGNFTVDSEGYLVTTDGDHVLNSEGKYVQVSTTAGDTQINAFGQIIQDGTVVDTISLVDFEDYNYLSRYGENMFDAVDGATQKEAEGSIYAGFLETSNISVVSEMVDMITVSRAYETNQKMITTVDGTLEIAVNQLGKL